MIDLNAKNPRYSLLTFHELDLAEIDALKGFDELIAALVTLSKFPEREFLGEKWRDEEQAVKNQRLVELLNAGAAAEKILDEIRFDEDAEDKYHLTPIEERALYTLRNSAREALQNYCAERMGRALTSDEAFALNIAFKL